MRSPTSPGLAPRFPVVAAAALALLAWACATSQGTPSPSTAPESPPASPSAATSASAAGSAPASEPAPPSIPASIDPANFTTEIDNPWYVLTPGTILTYRGMKDEESAIDVVTVTDRTIVIDGVTCRVIRDIVSHDDTPLERTSDYFAQDLDGNVWYFGEDTEELDENGTVTSTEGTWHSGVDGALPGIVMEAQPVVGHAFRQEYYKGHAEDHFEVLSLSESVTVPYGSFDDVLKTKEWTPLEPDILDNKFYARGVGLIREVTVQGGAEEFNLVSVEAP
jgi:hypothetical protein